MNNLNRRLDRLESSLGMKQERFLLIITAANRHEFPEDSALEKDEILPGVHVFCYGPSLSASEIEELREKYHRDIEL